LPRTRQPSSGLWRVGAGCLLRRRDVAVAEATTPTPRVARVRRMLRRRSSVGSTRRAWAVAWFLTGSHAMALGGLLFESPSLRPSSPKRARAYSLPMRLTVYETVPSTKRPAGLKLGFSVQEALGVQSYRFWIHGSRWGG